MQLISKIYSIYALTSHCFGTSQANPWSSLLKCPPNTDLTYLGFI